MYFNRFAYWEFSTGGQTGGLFVHMVDVVHWYLGLTRPLSCVALGGIYQYNDGRDTPDNINFILNYPQKVNVTFEATITDMIPRESADIVFYRREGTAQHLPQRLPVPAGRRRRTDCGQGRSGAGTHGATSWIVCAPASNPTPTPWTATMAPWPATSATSPIRPGSASTWKKEWDV